MGNKLVRKAKGSADETRPFKDGKGKMEVFHLGDSTVGRGEFEPGWRWSLHVKPIAGTPSWQRGVGEVDDRSSIAFARCGGEGSDGGL